MNNLTEYFTKLEEKDGIFFCTAKDIRTKFSEETQDSLFEIEDTSWWFQYRAEVIAAVAQKSFVFNIQTFDCGAGTDIQLCTCSVEAMMSRFWSPH